MRILDALLLATGFTGALTLVWLARLGWALLHPPRVASAHFSPHGGCTDVIVRALDAARHEVLLLAYGFTSRQIAQALVNAKLRGVHVEVILDHSNASDSRSEMAFLLEQGLVPLIDAHHAIAHNKVAVIDGKTVLTGSFNFTNNAETHNAENLLVLHHYPDLAAAYRRDFALHRDHSQAAGVAPQAAPAHQAHQAHPAHQGPHHAPHAEPRAEPHRHDAHDALEAVARSFVGAEAEEAEEAGAPRMTAAASEVLAKLRRQMADAADEAPRKTAA